MKSTFEGELGWHTTNDIDTYPSKIFRRVNGGINNRQLDLCPVGGRPIAFEDIEEIPDEEDEIEVKKKSYKILNITNKNFRDKLETSFHRRWASKDIEWPCRTGKMAK